MIFPFVTLTLLITLVPAIGRLDAIWIVGAASAAIAVALTTIAIAMSADRFARFSRLLRPGLILALAAPALWMLLQVIPMPAHRLVNPIWASASAALNQPLSGTITVDIGATLLSLAQYCVVVAAALVSAAVALDRRRAALLFYTLLAIATLVAIRQIALEMAAVDGLSLAAEGRAQAMVVAVIGILLACATAIQAVDQLSRTGRPQRSRSWAMITLSVAILSLLICGVAILIPADPVVVLAAAFGVGTLLAVFAIRRWKLGPWGAAGIAAAAAIGLLGGLASIPVKKNADLVTAFSMQPQPATERMLSDIAPAGSGAGTFKALLPIYQDLGTATTQEHPTAAAVITIEMGSTFLVGIIIVALLGAWILYNRSLSRGQDYVYAGAGAGALISLPITAFANGGVLTFSVSLLAGVLCGLAFAQSLRGGASDLKSSELQDVSDEGSSPHGKGRLAWSTTFHKKWHRAALAIFGLVLTAQAAWILSAEYYSQDHFSWSFERNVGLVGARRDEIGMAASIAAVRGDLWAESGLASMAQPWTDPGVALERDDLPAPALLAFTHALRYSPHRSDVWLMLAALASRYKPAGYDTAVLLRMSYYTAPNELRLLPLRLHVALGLEVSEPELRDMIKRDIRIVLSRLPELKPALVAAYDSAPANGKVFAENLISEVDPAYLKTMRTQRR